MNYAPLAHPMPLKKQQWPENTLPLVSVCCLTYNHGRFIRDAINGFLMQETTFPVEIIIHDDASSDDTADIIRGYSRAYPQLFRPVFQKENQYSQGGKPGRIVRKIAKGKYVAFCEGDDFWTDHRKLQLQVDFLESNPEFVVSGHATITVAESGDILGRRSPSGQQGVEFSESDLILGRAWLPHLSIVYRNVVIPPSESRFVKNGDKFMLSVLGQYGRGRFHPEISPAAYRQHGGGVWSSISAMDRRDERINTYYWLYRYYKRVGNGDAVQVYWFKFLNEVFSAIEFRVMIKVAISSCVRRFPFRRQLQLRTRVKKVLDVMRQSLADEGRRGGDGMVPGR